MTMTIVEFLHKNTMYTKSVLSSFLYTGCVFFFVSPVLVTSARCGCARGRGFQFDNADVLKDTTYRHSAVIGTKFEIAIKKK